MSKEWYVQEELINCQRCPYRLAISKCWHKHGPDICSQEFCPIKVTPCEWVEESENFWRTACGDAFMLNEGNPTENGFVFCPFCGNKIIEKVKEDL